MEPAAKQPHVASARNRTLDYLGERNCTCMLKSANPPAKVSPQPAGSIPLAVALLQSCGLTAEQPAIELAVVALHSTRRVDRLQGLSGSQLAHAQTVRKLMYCLCQGFLGYYWTRKVLHVRSVASGDVIRHGSMRSVASDVISCRRTMTTC